MEIPDVMETGDMMKEYGKLAEEACNGKGQAFYVGYAHGYFMLPWSGDELFPNLLEMSKAERKKIKDDPTADHTLNYSYGYVRGQIDRPDRVMRALA